MTFIKRKVFVDGQSVSALWKQRFAVVGLAGMRIPVGRRLFWVLQLGARVVLRNTVLQVEVVDTRVTVYKPWRIQPVIFTGVQVAMF